VLQEAWDYTAVPCKGVRGPLTLIPPSRPDVTRPAGPGSPYANDQPPPGQAGRTGGGPLYRLADYLDQHGRAYRKDQTPPARFWAAAAAHASPGDQATLGYAADECGLYRAATQLYKNAAAAGNLFAAICLSNPPPCLCGDTRPASWAASHASLDNPRGVALLLHALRETGAHEQAVVLADRSAYHASLDDPTGVALLLHNALLVDDPRGAAPRGNLMVRLRYSEQNKRLLPGIGVFQLSLEQQGRTDQFRFGREADGSPSSPWGWEDLDLWRIQPVAQREGVRLGTDQRTRQSTGQRAARTPGVGRSIRNNGPLSLITRWLSCDLQSFMALILRCCAAFTGCR
jgi:hypothetical protein